MSDHNRGKVWGSIIPFLMLGLAIWAVIEEFRYRSEAKQTVATVKDWRSRRLGGYRGTATADIDIPGTDGVYADRSIRTQLWYRPEPGDRIPVFYQPGATTGRVDSIWQGFLLPAGMGLIAVGWLAEIWWPRRRNERQTD